MHTHTHTCIQAAPHHTADAPQSCTNNGQHNDKSSESNCQWDVLGSCRQERGGWHEGAGGGREGEKGGVEQHPATATGEWHMYVLFDPCATYKWFLQQAEGQADTVHIHTHHRRLESRKGRSLVLHTTRGQGLAVARLVYTACKERVTATQNDATVYANWPMMWIWYGSMTTYRPKL